MTTRDEEIPLSFGNSIASAVRCVIEVVNVLNERGVGLRSLHESIAL